jgi:DNA primase
VEPTARLAEVKEAVRRAVPIEAVVGETVRLRRQGNRLVGLCPFHAEKTPSFSVSPERGLFYCFGCQAGGDVFDFVMRRDGVTFGEALKVLAERAGVALPEREATPADRRRDEMLQALERAAKLYERHLQGPAGAGARAYLEERGVSTASVRLFRLGLAPAGGRDLVEALRREGFGDRILVEAGLALARDGRLVDRFRGRLMFPIRDGLGRVIGFGARRLEGEGPKYLNSPDGPLFKKGQVLYDLSLARPHLRKADRVILVEGYMDVIGLHQVGLPEVLAPMGTALGEEQVREIARHVRLAVIAYDGDRAGQAATARSLWLLARAGVDVRVASLPPDLDPDELARRDPDALRAAIEAAAPLTAFLVREAAKAGEWTPKRKAETARRVIAGILLLPDPVEQEAELRRLAAALDVPEDTLRREVRNIQRKEARSSGGGLESARPRNTGRQRSLRQEIEVAIISLLARDPSLVDAVTEGFTDPDAAAILAALRRGEDPAALEEASARQLWAEAASREEHASLPDLIERLRREGQRERLDELRREISRLEKAGHLVPAAMVEETMRIYEELKAPTERGATP